MHQGRVGHSGRYGMVRMAIGTGFYFHQLESLEM
jgi:hypothetical protein